MDRLQIVYIDNLDFASSKVGISFVLTERTTSSSFVFCDIFQCDKLPPLFADSPQSHGSKLIFNDDKVETEIVIQDFEKSVPLRLLLDKNGRFLHF